MKGVPFLLFLVLLGAWPAMAVEKEGILVVDRFTRGVDAKGLPEGWTLEKTPGSQSVIAVEKGNEFNFLHLKSVDDNFGLKKEISFDIRKHPYFSWRWRAKETPPQGDIRKRETDDQAGQIYVVFPKFPATVNSRSVGYIWDSKAPAGISGTSTAYSKMKYVVLQSGSGKLNQWIAESRNVYQDYKKLFNEEPPEVGAVLIYINTQHTHGKAAIDYADIQFSSTPNSKP